VIGGLIVVLLIALAVPTLRRWLLAKLLRRCARRCLAARPGDQSDQARRSVAGLALLNAAYISALVVRGARLRRPRLVRERAVVYLAGAAIGSAAAYPRRARRHRGGAVDRARGDRHAQCCRYLAVLMYRIATFWLPVPVGWAAAQYLQSRNAL